jgi:tetratricopeptide (TPR) repeat protein
MAEGKLDEAEKIFTDILSAPADMRATAHANLSIGEYISRKKDFGKAIQYSEKALELATKAKAIDLQEMASTQVFNVSKASENYKRALEVREFNYKLKDSVKKLQMPWHNSSSNMISRKRNCNKKCCSKRNSKPLRLKPQRKSSTSL